MLTYFFLPKNELFYRFGLWPTISDHFGTILKNFIFGSRFVVQVQSKNGRFLSR